MDGVYDIVMFMGVLYHLKNPMSGLNKVRKLTAETLILETHVSCEELDYPAMKFYPEKELCDDGSNWWAPNVKCLEGMLRSNGFDNYTIVDRSEFLDDYRLILICTP